MWVCFWVLGVILDLGLERGLYPHLCGFVLDLVWRFRSGERVWPLENEEQRKKKRRKKNKELKSLILELLQ